MNNVALSSKEMAELDRKMIDEYEIGLTVMMENAGRSIALQAGRFLGGSLLGKKILVLSGKGNNGGGGLASARHMHNRGAYVEVLFSSSKSELREVSAKQLGILERMGVTILDGVDEIRIKEFALLIDALLGYNQRGNPRGMTGQLVELANSSGVPILANDIPTGLDPDTGHPGTPCIRATQTLTLAVPKIGMLKNEAKPYLGDLFLADISIPRKLYKDLGLYELPDFSNDQILHLT